jgi:threonine/homoserine/homoserine lactone efflux protein
MTGRIAVFVALTFLMLVVPGPDFVLITRNTITGSRARGYLTAGGICVGLAFLTGLAASGVAAAVAGNGTVLVVLHVVGGAYLVAIAVQLLLGIHKGRRSIRTGQDHDSVLDTHHQSGPRSTSPVVQGFLNNVLNPKALVFYLTFIPQFLEPGRPVFTQTLSLGLLVVLCAATWWGCYVTAIGGLSRLLGKRSVRTGIDLVAAGALSTIGVVVMLGGI